MARNIQCDGNTPSCAACSSVYGTECVYDPNSDHRRKGVYKKDIDNLKTRNSTLQTLIQAILNYPENEVSELVKQIRTCESLDDVAEAILQRDNALGDDDDIVAPGDIGTPSGVPKFEKELSGKMGKLRLDNGSMSIIGGTSNLIFIDNGEGEDSATDDPEQYEHPEDAITSWTEVTSDPELVVHLLNMYFTWHYTYFTTLSKSLFWRDFLSGNSDQHVTRKTVYCTPLLVNAMLALGCHFTSWPQARAEPKDSASAGDHFFREAKRLVMENDEHENPRLATVQALALMSVREAGCGREARGWVYSGMSFRMAYDLGLNIESGSANLDEAEVDAQRITIWGCFLFDKYVFHSFVKERLADDSDVGQTISDGNLNCHYRASQSLSSRSSQWRTRTIGRLTQTMVLAKRTLNLRERALSLYRHLHCVRLVVICYYTFTTHTNCKSRWASKQN